MCRFTTSLCHGISPSIDIISVIQVSEVSSTTRNHTVKRYDPILAMVIWIFFSTFCRSINASTQIAGIQGMYLNEYIYKCIESMIVCILCLYITLPHCHHYADVSKCTGFLKYLSGTFCRVCLRLSEFYQLSFMLYVAVCIQFTHFSYDDCENKCDLA